jgi:predicted nucleotidyltransferase
MISLIQEHREALDRLCVRYHVRSLELFGSALSAERFNNAASDLDLLVEFFPLEPGQRADTYFGLREELETLFDRPVDLVMSKAIRNPYFRQALDRSCELLYAA